jgi:hypothetical protein
MAGPSRAGTRGGVAVTVVAVLLVASSVAAGADRTTRVSGWDRRIAPIAHQVERLRHLKFLHPIPARFLSDRAFHRLVTSEGDRPSKRARRRNRTAEAELRTLGLVDGAFDLGKTVDDVNGADVLAFYDPDKKRIVVRGTSFDAEHRVTLAHELTHGLQDQHYDLTRLQDRADSANRDDALTALVEGDATRIEGDYYDTLSRKDQRAVDRAESADPTAPANGSEPANPDVGAAGDSFVGAQLESPYATGPAMVEVLLAHGHRAELARAFRQPPSTQLQMVQPARAASRVRPARLAAPRPARGTHRLANGPDDIGAMDLYFLLASRLPDAVALQAADAWGNGRELMTERRDHTICADLAFAGRDRATSRRLGDAIRLWAAAMPAGAVTVDATGLRIHGCDPGPAATAPPNSAEDALGFAADRAFVEASMVAGRIPLPLATCMTDRAVSRPDYAQFVAVATSQRTPSKAEERSFRQTLDELVGACSGR